MAKNIFFLAGMIVMIGLSCTKENQVSPALIDEIDFDTVTFNHSIKGWELYSWPGETSWNYALLGGTNRLKSYEEVMASPYKVSGVESLRILLSCLPENEDVIWIEENWLAQIWEEPYHNLQLPPEDVVSGVKQISKELKINLWVSY